MTTELVPVERPPLPAAARDQLVDEWLAGRKATTRRAYAGDLDAFAAWWGAPTDLVVEKFLRLSSGEANSRVLAWKNSMFTEDLASATVGRRLAAIRSLVKLARTLGRVSWSIEIQNPKPEPRRDVRGPDEGMRKKLWKTLQREADGEAPTLWTRDRALYALMFGMGLRRAEVVALDLVDADFRERTLAVLGKGRREKSRLPIPPEVARALSAWVVIRGTGEGPLFTRCDRAGSMDRLTGDSVARAIARIGKAAGVDRKVRPHGLRHAGITAALSRGNNVRDVARFSRHAKIETVMRYDDERQNTAGKVSEGVAKELK